VVAREHAIGKTDVDVVVVAEGADHFLARIAGAGATLIGQNGAGDADVAVDVVGVDAFWWLRPDANHVVVQRERQDHRVMVHLLLPKQLGSGLGSENGNEKRKCTQATQCAHGKTPLF
jgi:hypothetical protein